MRHATDIHNQRAYFALFAKLNLFRRLPDLANAMTAHEAGNGDGGQR